MIGGASIARLKLLEGSDSERQPRKILHILCQCIQLMPNAHHIVWLTGVAKTAL